MKETVHFHIYQRVKVEMGHWKAKNLKDVVKIGVPAVNIGQCVAMNQ